MPTIKNIFTAISLASSVIAFGAHADSNAAKPSPANAGTPMSALPHPPMPGAQPNGQAHPMGAPAQSNIMTELNLTEPQKQKMLEWRKLQQQHMQDNMNSQANIEELAAADKFDESAVKALAEKLGTDTQKYYVEYAQKNHAFISSLTSEQREKMVTIQKQRKEQLQQMRERMKEQMKNTPPAGAIKPAPAK
jgi:protein CpxP